MAGPRPTPIQQKGVDIISANRDQVFLPGGHFAANILVNFQHTCYDERNLFLHCLNYKICKEDCHEHYSACFCATEL